MTHDRPVEIRTSDVSFNDGVVAEFVGNAVGRLRGAKHADVAHNMPGVHDGDINVLRGTLLSLVRRDGRDLTARQLTVFLTVYIDDAVHSVSSLAELLRISRPGITRVMDRLVQFDLVSREEDQRDRRRVLVRRTPAGSSFCNELLQITREAAALVRAES